MERQEGIVGVIVALTAVVVENSKETKCGGELKPYLRRKTSS